MKSSKIFVFAVIVIVVIALAVWAGFVIAGMQAGATNPSGASPYSAVYLTSGDIYFGKLSWFPSPHMTDVWYVTRNQGQSGETQLGIAAMKSVFWGPSDEVNFNAQDILFWTRLENSSQVVQAITGQLSGQSSSSPASSAPSAPSQTPSTAPSLPVPPTGSSTTSTH
jgi:hypothetical protein